MTSTASGSPEVVVNTSNVDAINGAIIADLVKYKYQIEKDTPYLLELARPTNSNEDFAVSLSIGNAYSTNDRVASYTFLKTAEGIRVIVSTSLRAHMVGGQTNTMQLNDNGAVYNTFQQQLFDIKKQIEVAQQ